MSHLLGARAGGSRDVDWRAAFDTIERQDIPGAAQPTPPCERHLRANCTNQQRLHLRQRQSIKRQSVHSQQDILLTDPAHAIVIRFLCRLGAGQESKSQGKGN